VRFVPRVLTAIASGGLATVLAVLVGSAPVSAATTAGWGNAQQVPAPATRPQIGGGIAADACSPGGYCAAVGTYWPAGTLGVSDPYVVTIDNGRVGKLQHIDTAPLVNGPLGSHGKPQAEMDVVACPSQGNCTALGDYNSFDFGQYPFVVNEVKGTWGQAHPVAGIQPLGLAIAAVPVSLACSSTGNCVAGGTFDNSSQSQNTVPFVVSERSGVWGSAQAIKGLPPVADIEFGGIDLSCSTSIVGADRLCMGVGFYQTSDANAEFVVTEHDGTWNTAGPVPGLPAGSAPAMVSCSLDGVCTVAGYGNAAQHSKLFTVTEYGGGKWTPEALVPGNAITGQNYDLLAFSCGDLGSCSMGGWHAASDDIFVPWLATQHEGTWSKAEDVPGSAALDHGLQAQLTQMSCGSRGNCSGGGLINVHVTAHLIRIQAFVVSENNGRWGNAILVPGIVKLDGEGNSHLTAMTCASANHCVAGGVYTRGRQLSPYAFVAVRWFAHR
jgi:hypothetical protein